MAEPRGDDVTQLLVAWGAGDLGALDGLLPLVYGELHGLAHRRMRRESPDQTLQTTALVHEAYVRLVDGTRVSWNNRAHFFAVCARLMRRILVDRARCRRSGKRGGDAVHVQFQPWLAVRPAMDDEILAVDEALSRLAAHDPRRSRIVEMRYFGGLTVSETAAALNISPETVARDWKMARLWLHHELTGGPAAIHR